MSNCPKHLTEAIAILVEIVKLQTPSNQLQRILNELTTAYYRFVLPGLGWRRLSYTAKLTAEEKQAADAFAITLSLKVLPQLLESFEKGCELAHASQSSRSTYSARLRSALVLIESEPWYPGNGILNRRSLDECRPKMRHGRGDWRAFSLMSKGKPIKYRLEPHEISPALQQQLDAFQHFMTDANHVDRCFAELKLSTAEGYHSGILLWLGWLLHEENPTLKPENLTLELLIPKLSEDMLEDLSENQRKRVWREHQRQLEERINHYFDFLLVKQQAESPRTHVLKLATLLMLSKFLYASEVEEKEDYDQIPLIRTLHQRLDREQEDVAEWEKHQRYVADQSRKWPEPPAGQTVLEYVQATLIESLRLECRPRQSTGDFCKGHIIAKSHLIYLLFVDLGLFPPGRQQEPRSYRIALSCPVQRPETVPRDGVYWPLPPDWARVKGPKGTIQDNYLYRTYHYDGQRYDQGVWVFETRNFKTDKFHGVRVDMIPNLSFSDGQYLYDYLDRYLCGQWYVGTFHSGQRYCWWDPQLQGKYGKWLSQGRAEFCTADTPVFVQSNKTEDWVSSYLFLAPTSGKPFTDNQMSEYFARNSFRIIGKRITPHTFRYMWATFSSQAGLSDAEMRSLATAMGCTRETLQRMYDRMSPAGRNRPINEVMQQRLPWHANLALTSVQDNTWGDIQAKWSQLSPEQRRQLRQFLGLDPAT